MPWGVAAAVAGAATSAALAPSGGGGGGGGGGGPNYYTPTGLGAADTAWQNLLNQQLGTQGGISNLSPLYQQALEQGLYFGQSYAPGYAGAAGQAAQYSGGLGSTLAQQAAQNYGTQQALLGAGQNIYNLGLDPQQALYNRTRQQVQEQTGATNAMYGLGSSAAGAGLANQALSNFNIDWQNQQLQRAMQGLQGYTGAAQAGGGYGQLATSQAGQVPGLLLQSGQLPYQTAQTIAGLPTQLANQYATGMEQGPLGSAAAISGQVIPYLNYGAGAQALPYQQQLQGAGALGSAVSQGIQGLGNYASQGGFSSNLWGSNSPFGGSSGWSDYGGFGGSSPVTGLSGGGANYSMPSYGVYGY